MFSQTVEYALRAVVYLATEHAAANRMNSEQIAKATSVPQAYLSKVLKQLAHGEIITSARGAKGGFAIARPPAQISILEIVNAVEPFQRIKTCPLGLSAHYDQLCALHCRMDRSLEIVESELRNSTLADIIADPNPSVPLCDVPRKKSKAAKTRSNSRRV